MTANRNFKRRVRSHAAKTGESYTAALRHFRQMSTGDKVPAAKSIRLAVAQTIACEDPHDGTAMRQRALEVQRLMRSASQDGARVVHFPEGAICSPNKRVISISGPEEVGPSDWDQYGWERSREELGAIAALAAELRLWTVIGSAHRLTSPHRPYNSMYVISDAGKVSTRYDERMLSSTKVSYMYTPGSSPVTFDVDGFRFGCLLGMEVHFPELFAEYEQLDVDCVLFSSTGDGTGNFARQAQGHAGTNNYWIGFSVFAQNGAAEPSGIIAPTGEWLARCEESSSLAIVDLDDGSESLEEALRFARPWRRTARAGIYEPHYVRDDPRIDRATF